MKINHNMSAVVANKQLLRTEGNLSGSLERLSSGLRINRASDDAAGMAIATKMNAQIKGLDQASRNALDGVSVINTVDGTLGEVTSMLQRMRELSVQAASDTNTKTDVVAVQREITSLRDEIDRVSKDTEYNTKPLLDGSLDQRVYANSRGITRIEISDSVEVDTYKFTIPAGGSASQATVNGASVSSTASAPEGTIVINGVSVKVEAGESFDMVYAKLRDTAETGEVDLQVSRDTAAGTAALKFVSERYGDGVEMNVTCSNAQLATYLGIPMANHAIGEDVQITRAGGVDGFSDQVTMLTDGRNVKVTDRNGFEINFEVSEGTEGNIELEVTDIGTMRLQIGANENQCMNVRIPEISSRSLYIDDADVTTVTGADRAISSFDDALSKVSQVRARIGAYQNRLDSAVKSLDDTGENMTAAISRIEDIDMAKEMSEYTKYNVLSQAATSVLSQANDLPQQALQLLQ
ncbi:MAG: flagellin [Lachnospiraceae bacterium]